jgi:hypothetical protein
MKGLIKGYGREKRFRYSDVKEITFVIRQDSGLEVLGAWNQ